jgi:hypothetical protein
VPAAESVTNSCQSASKLVEIPSDLSIQAINDALSPIVVSAGFLSSVGIQQANGGYRKRDFPLICQAIAKHAIGRAGAFSGE